MSGRSGESHHGLTGEQLEEWIREQQNSNRDHDKHQGGEKNGENPNSIREVTGNTAQQGVRTPEPQRQHPSVSKRTWSSRESPENAGSKRFRPINQDTAAYVGGYITVKGLRQAFLGAREMRDISLYAFSLGFIPLLGMRKTWEATCMNCGMKHDVSLVNFKPRYSFGQPIFELNCSNAECKAVTATDDMSSAIKELLSRLSQEELEMTGLVTEAVSDSEEGTAYVINKPMPWLGELEQSAVFGKCISNHWRRKTNERERATATWRPRRGGEGACKSNCEVTG